MLQDKKKKSKEDIPKLGKQGNIVKWIDLYRLYLQTVIGARNVSLTYVGRASTDVSNMPPPVLTPNQWHYNAYGSVDDKLVQWTSYDHALFQNDEILRCDGGRVGRNNIS